MQKLLKIFLLLAVAGLFTCVSAQAQSVTTESISFKLEDVTEMFMPPDLRMNIKFVDANNNNILEAEECGYIKLNIVNKINVKIFFINIKFSYCAKIIFFKVIFYYFCEERHSVLKTPQSDVSTRLYKKIIIIFRMWTKSVDSCPLSVDFKIL